MKHFVVTGLIAAAAALLVNAAHAGPIPDGSTINVTGSATFTSTQVNFSSPAALTPGTGAFTSLGTCSTCVVVTTPLTFSPFTAALVFTASNLGNTATVSVTSEIDAPVINASQTALLLHDNATLTLTGFDATQGILTLTVNQNTRHISGSFSATGETVVHVVEPGTLAIFGLGLGALGLLYTRRRA